MNIALLFLCHQSTHLMDMYYLQSQSKNECKNGNEKFIDHEGTISNNTLSVESIICSVLLNGLSSASPATTTRNVHSFNTKLLKVDEGEWQIVRRKSAPLFSIHMSFQLGLVYAGENFWIR